jgi:hypothetical protein
MRVASLVNSILHGASAHSGFKGPLLLAAIVPTRRAADPSTSFGPDATPTSPPHRNASAGGTP